MSEWKPLNPTLYRLLKRRFGTVKVSSAGEAMQARYTYNPIARREQLDVRVAGEYYMVNCPFCNDTKYRLYVNHMWGKKDEEGQTNLWLAICYNETACLSKFENVLSLREEVTELEGVLEKARVREGVEVDLNDVRIEWPGPVKRVDLLPKDHKAVQYLLSRSFDPKRIGRFYNAHYCIDSFNWLARERIIIPVYDGGEMKGWQARHVGEMNWGKPDAPPKYYTSPGMPRRLLIYNLANAARYRTGVIVEGPTDVWSLGPMSCCTLGSTMTFQQQRKFHARFKEHAAILLFDPEEYEKEATQKLIRGFEGQFDRGFAAVKLPPGTDPGKLDRHFLREYIADEARVHGVEVSWKKR